MNYYEMALRSDINEDYIEAINYYELEREIEGVEDTYINLSFIYWMSGTNYSFIHKYEISDELSIRGGENYSSVIQEGLLKYPESLELRFWQKYYENIISAEEVTEKYCLELISTYNLSKSKVPYFVLYLHDKVKYKKERDELIIICKNHLTAKNRYILSIIG